MHTNRQLSMILNLEFFWNLLTSLSILLNTGQVDRPAILKPFSYQRWVKEHHVREKTTLGIERFTTLKTIDM